ncbi:MAG: hypothetical protein ACPGFC_07225, partial [Paracoccaceae bacterium]
LTDQHLKTLIQDHKTQGATDRPLYQLALKELDRRTPYQLQISLDLIIQAARDRRFLTYKELADAHGIPWSVARLTLPAHLWTLVEWAHGEGLPMLSAIIVTKHNRHTGRMEPPTLAGFIEAAHQLGHTVTDAETFLRDQQRAIFAHFATHSAPE